MCLYSKTHSINIDTPFKGDKREFLFDDIVPVEIFDPKPEELNNFSESTGIKLADPFGKRCLR